MHVNRDYEIDPCPFCGGSTSIIEDSEYYFVLGDGHAPDCILHQTDLFEIYFDMADMPEVVEMLNARAY